MRFTPVALAGAYIIDIQPLEDERGFFARTWCARELADHGLDVSVAQSSIAYNRARGTLRGLHYQGPPAAEVKLVRCTAGAIHDVIVDVRPQSATYLQHVAVELSAENHRTLYIPVGFAHGYQTLTDEAEVTYQMSEFQASELARGLRHDDPALAIAWPLPVTIISDRDQRWELLSRAAVRS